MPQKPKNIAEMLESFLPTSLAQESIAGMRARRAEFLPQQPMTTGKGPSSDALIKALTKAGVLSNTRPAFSELWMKGQPPWIPFHTIQTDAPSSSPQRVARIQDYWRGQEKYPEIRVREAAQGGPSRGHILLNLLRAGYSMDQQPPHPQVTTPYEKQGYPLTGREARRGPRERLYGPDDFMPGDVPWTSTSDDFQRPPIGVKRKR